MGSNALEGRKGLKRLHYERWKSSKAIAAG